MDVSGHSLGGHLAMAFSRLFSGNTGSVTAVNGAGFNLANTNVNNLFAMFGGSNTFDAGKILNVIGSAAPNVVSQDWLLLQQPAGRQDIYTESASPSAAFGHGSSQMTDSLAVYDLLIRLSSQIRSSAPVSALATLKPLFEASSAQAGSSLECIVDALVNLFQLEFPPLNGNLISKRDEFYKRIVPLQGNALGAATSFVEDAHAQNLLVHPYTFRSESFFLPVALQKSDSPAAYGDHAAEYAAFFAAGVDGLFTDNVDHAFKARALAAARAPGGDTKHVE